jgi:DNA-binding GntR family transcriptional regulator
MIPTLGLQAYDSLRQMLVSGQLAPGMQLVNRKLADEIGMSMTPVREAVTRLASEGFVDHVPGAGAFVRRISRHELSQLYDVREALEPGAAAQAATNATPSEIAEMREIAYASFRIVRAIADQPQGHADGDLMARWLASDQRFHEIVFEASRNRWLSKIATDMKILAYGFSPQRRIAEFLTVSAAVSTWRGHRRLIKALRKRDPESAARIVLEHIRQGKQEVFAHLAAQTATPADSNPARQPIARRGRPKGSKSKPKPAAVARRSPSKTSARG